jgi:hypothetical protein
MKTIRRKWVNSPHPTLTPGMLEETPEGVSNPRHPQTQDRHRKGAEGGVRGPLPKGEHFRVRKICGGKRI